MNTATDSPKLTCGFRLLENVLVFDLRITNPTSADWGVFGRLKATFPDGSFHLSPNLVYIDLIDDILKVGKFVLPVPEGLNVGGRQAPWVLKLAAGKELAEEVRVPVPVSVCQPYRRAKLAAEVPGADVVADQRREVKEVEFVLGAFPLTAEMRLTPISPAYPTVFEVWPPGLALDGQKLLSQRLQLPTPIAVLDYRVVPPPEKKK